MPLHLAGKSLVVIGGTTGLGLSSVRAFVRNGVRVVAIGRNRESCEGLEHELGENACAISADACTSNAAAEAINRFGRFDGLYHVAGGSGRAAGDGPLHEPCARNCRTAARLEYISDVRFKSNVNSHPASVSWRCIS